jgi:serine/threonine protein kinase
MEIPGYADLTEIGRGGFSVVYSALETAFEREVAVKVIQAADWQGDVQARFERECRAVGALSWHPHIVTVYNAGSTPAGIPYLVMSLAVNGSTAERLRTNGAMPWTEAVRIAVAVAGAVESAHRAGRIHRDIKPENILLGHADAPMLADFGISAIVATTGTRTTGITASIAHAPPEILDGERATPRSDVYSLGSTLHALLAGRAAFLVEGEQTLVPLFRRIALDPVPDLRPRGVP